MSSIIAIGPCQRSQIFVLKKTCFSRPMRISTFWCEKSIIRSSINYAKDWLDQRVSHICMWSLGVSQQPFSCVLGQFRHDGDKQPTEQPLVFLEQACSWPVKRQSFAIFGHVATAQRTRLANKGWPCGKEDRSFWCCQGIFFPHTTDVLSCRQEMFVNIYWFRISKAFLIIFSYLRHWYK